LAERISKSKRKSKKTQQELAGTKSQAKGLSDGLRVFEDEALRLRTTARSFCDLANQFETVALKRVTLSPVVPMDRPGDAVLVRTDPVKAADRDVKLDDQLLPIDLRYLLQSSTAKSRYWVARRIKSAEGDMLSRSAAYFQ
jgi:hypothetical protein